MKKKKYRVTWDETLFYDLEIEAENEDEARDKFDEMNLEGLEQKVSGGICEVEEITD